jgi:hypothetical protein
MLALSSFPGLLGLGGLPDGMFCDPGGRGGKPIDYQEFQLGNSQVSTVTLTPQVQLALPQWVSRTFGSPGRYENALSPNQTFLEHIGSKRPAFSKLPGPTMLFCPPIDWKTILVSD